MSVNNRQSITINFAGHEFQLLSSGCCYWPLKKTLIVSDLHLEKGSYFALRGQPLPIADTRCTIERLQQEIIRVKPETVICLGDNVHDAKGFMRMLTEDLLLLQSLCNNVCRWEWVIGNHDSAILTMHPFDKMRFVSEVIIDNLCFTHDFQKEKPMQIIGHFHPKISIKMQGVTITGKCFSVTSKNMIMPAFGSYTGGLEVNHKVYNEILHDLARHYLIYNNSIFLVK